MVLCFQWFLEAEMQDEEEDEFEDEEMNEEGIFYLCLSLYFVNTGIL